MRRRWTNVRWFRTPFGSINNVRVNEAAAASWLPQTRWLEEILWTIAEFGSASLGLIAWELSLDESELAPAWEQALRTGLIRPAHTCPATHEEMYSLARQAAAGLDRPPPPRAVRMRASGRL